MKIISARSFWVPVMLTTLVATFFAAVLQRQGRSYVELRRTESRLEQRLAALKEENRRLRIERTELLTDLGAVERAARQELNLVVPGESVIVAEDVATPPAPEAPPPMLGPVATAVMMPQFTRRAMLAALAGSAAVFLLWNLSAAVAAALVRRLSSGRQATASAAEPTVLADRAKRRSAA